jgi:hypothetical protein
MSVTSASAPVALSDVRTRAKFRWRRKSLADMSRLELEDALLELNGMYLGALDHIGRIKAVQLVPVELAGDASLSWEWFVWGAVLGCLGGVTLMFVGAQ